MMQFQVPGSSERFPRQWFITDFVQPFWKLLLLMVQKSGQPVEVKVVEIPSFIGFLYILRCWSPDFSHQQYQEILCNHMKPSSPWALGIIMGKPTGDLWYRCFLWWSRTVGCVPRFVYQFGRAEGIHKVAICQCFLYREGYLIPCEILRSQLEIRELNQGAWSLPLNLSTIKCFANPVFWEMVSKRQYFVSEPLNPW